MTIYLNPATFVCVCFLAHCSVSCQHNVYDYVDYVNMKTDLEILCFVSLQLCVMKKYEYEIWRGKKPNSSFPSLLLFPQINPHVQMHYG